MAAPFPSSLDRLDPRPGSRPRWRRPSHVALLLLTIVSLAACATKRDVRDLSDDIRSQNQQQAALIAELRDEQARLQELVRTMASTGDDRHVQLMRRIAELQDEVEFVREVAGASQAGLAAVRDQLVRGGGSGPGGQTAGGFHEGGTEAAGEVDEIWREALTAHGRQSIAAARIGFEEIVNRFPGHDLVPDARYYLADIASLEGELDDALHGFLQIAELHPTAPRVPEALYRAGLIHRDRGEADRARDLFTRIVNTWPESEVADMARAFLGGSRR